MHALLIAIIVGLQHLAASSIKGSLDEARRELAVRKDAEEALRRHRDQLEDIVLERTASLRKLSTAVEHSASAIIITNRDGVIEYVNPKFCEMTEYSKEEVLGQNPRILKGGDQPEEFYQTLWEQILSGEQWQGEFQNRTKGGRLAWDLSSISPIFDDAGEITHFVAVKEDITERKRLQDELTKQAHYDKLTGLPNRVLFFDRLAQVLALSKRKERRFCLLFIDLDGFKAVNDTYGHDTGDLLLMEVAKKLQGVLRESDTAARMGGDEFTLLLTDLNQFDEAKLVSERILKALGEPLELGGHTCHIGACIGIARYPDDAADGEGLLAAADEAMYEVKRSGKNAYRFASIKTSPL